MQSLPDAMQSVLEDRRYAVLATQNDDGSIHLTPVWYLFDDNYFFVESLSTDRKVRNLIQRPGATVIVDVRDLGSERWIYASGTADILDGEAACRINNRILQRYLTAEGLEDAVVGPTFAGAVDITIRLTPKVWRSWSVQDLDDQYFGGTLGRTPLKWFRPLDP